MSVYVDSARNKLGRMLMSHMTADTLEELHGMADRLGFQRGWFQGGARPHYDVCQRSRALAVEHGARVVSSKEIVRVARRLRGAERRAEAPSPAVGNLTATPDGVSQKSESETAAAVVGKDETR